MSSSRERFYRTDQNSVDVATTYLVLDKNIIYPQARSTLEVMIAEHLLENFGKPNELTLVQISEANIDPEIAWEYTWKIHASYGIGTDKVSFRNPNLPNSHEVYPKSKEYLAIFVKSFVVGAINFINSNVRSKFNGINSYTSVLELQQLLEDDLNLRQEILAYCRKITDGLEMSGKGRREFYRDESKKKYGPGGVKYHRENFE